MKLRQSGPLQLPLILFDDDPQYEKGIAFCAAVLQRGVYLHPRHNMFLCGAHGEKEIDRALEATAGAFEELRRSSVSSLGESSDRGAIGI